MSNTAMEDTISDTSQFVTASADVDHSAEHLNASNSNFEKLESKHDVNIEEIRIIMEVMANTGQYWHDWDMLRGLLSFWMKQVLAEYNEAQTDNSSGPQKCSLVGETYQELVKRLDEALLSFTEGPPFTLQRLCEILLVPKDTYSNLSKLALALEKNLLVTSTLSKCTEPYPGVLGKKHEAVSGNETPNEKTIPISNGVEPAAGDRDEEMTDAETVEDATIADTEMQEHKASETSTEAVSDSKASEETGETNEEQSPST
ncbi:serine/threonine-protein phosphatase 4 regulatory subunit 2-like [Zingiber officinale]|uniref:serine/threonine-protein phosphatase 4 regulatory subunit 2-like n=1 Tax=Zingiber officinale TaxID=94328 RepID=UPI001C4B953F|nr:serine/threonine-protein phosphatase 4 regulatory subunit 2-like [Zingiber officinale]XP_042422346.1 serine/threonine-protein phosphatase 4 regulatory subunit 2-like [Zingiber officinale]